MTRYPAFITESSDMRFLEKEGLKHPLPRSPISAEVFAVRVPGMLPVIFVVVDSWRRLRASERSRIMLTFEQLSKYTKSSLLILEPEVEQIHEKLV